MASYTYPTNPVAPPPNQVPASFPNYGTYPNQPDNQWSQPTAYGQPGQQGASYPPVYDQNAYAGQPPQIPPNYQAAAPASDYGSNFAPSYGGGPKGGNFRGNNAGNNRNSGPGFNKGPRSNFGNDSAMEEQQDTIFVSGLPEETTEDELKDYFGAIGLIKMDKKTRKPKIWVYKDKETGKPKGEVTITYDDPPTASSAISWFDGKPFKGCELKVQLAQRKNNFLASGGGGPPRGNFGGGGGFNRGGGRDFDRKGGGERNNAGGGGPPREGDWVCDDCQNNNFAWRDSCNRCKAEKPASAGGGGGGSQYGSDRRGGNLPYERRGPANGSRGDRGSFGGGPRNNRNQDRGSFGGGRGGDQRGPRNGGGPMRPDGNRRANPY